MSTQTVSTLNDLLQITNDRIEGFNKAAEKVSGENSTLKGEYLQMASQSQEMKSNLSSLVREKGGDPDTSATLAGGLHRTWIDVKNAFSGDNSESTLENVTFGENAAIEAYEDALKSGNLCPESTMLVQNQLQQLRSSHEKFKSLAE